MNNEFINWTDEQLKAAYVRVDDERTKAGLVTVRALRRAGRLEAEAKRRGHEFPCSWLASSK